MTAKISKVEVFSIGMPLVGMFTSGGVSKKVTKCVVVRVTDSDGATGISSIDPSSMAKSPHTGPELALAIQERIGPALIGKDPGHINQICEMASKLTPLQPGAVVGVELACIELVCRRRGIALHDYVGGALLDRLQFNGWVGELPPEEAVAEALRWKNAGFKSMKIKVGNDAAKDSARVKAVREAVGKDIKLRMDANMLPTHLVHSSDHKHHHLANLAFGGADRKTIYITESLSGDILMAKMPVAGKLLYGHM